MWSLGGGFLKKYIALDWAALLHWCFFVFLCCLIFPFSLRRMPCPPHFPCISVLFTLTLMNLLLSKITITEGQRPNGKAYLEFFRRWLRNQRKKITITFCNKMNQSIFPVILFIMMYGCMKNFNHLLMKKCQKN